MVRRIPNQYGGGARTNTNGLLFEQMTSLDDALIEVGYKVDKCVVYDEKNPIGLSVPKYNLYNMFLVPSGIDYRNYNSKQWLPDECFINFDNNVAYIIEKKFQNSSGSVDEKLPGCHFKKMEYEKLFYPLKIGVEYLYVFNDWFLDPRYRDTLDYVHNMGCEYFFNAIPLDYLGL